MKINFWRIISRALNGQSWDTIWELDPENMMSEDNYYLQLFRWFALYKCNACFVERRFDKEVQDCLVISITGYFRKYFTFHIDFLYVETACGESRVLPSVAPHRDGVYGFSQSQGRYINY